MSARAVEISYAVRLRVLLRHLGQLMLALAVLSLVPCGVALAAGESRIYPRYALLILLLTVAGGLLARLRIPRNIQRNEAMTVVALIFLITPLLMTYPLMGSGLGFLDALFEAVSAATTTGLSTTATVADKPTTFLFARAWMQWYGGLGIVVLSLALFLRPGLVAKRLAVMEEVEDDLVGGTKAHARRVLGVYLLLTGAGVVLVWGMSGEPFDSLLYILSAVSTGGFAPHDTSLAGLGGAPVQWAVMLFCFSASFSLALYHQARHQGLRHFLTDGQLLAVGGSALAAALLLVGCLHLGTGMAWKEALHQGPLLAFSAQTTAGFSAMDLSGLDDASKLVVIFSMAVGGGAGSTAGGFKVLRLMILLRLLQVLILRTCLPAHGVLEPRLGRRRLERGEVEEALCIVLLFVAVVLLSWLPFLLYGYDPLDALFEVVSATGTVGLSSGVTSAGLPGLLKGVLCIDMLLGRLELVAWLVLFYPRTWIGKRRRS